MSKNKELTYNKRAIVKLAIWWCFFIWQSIPAIFVAILFVIFVRWLRVDWRILAGFGAAVAIVCILKMLYLGILKSFLVGGFYINYNFWNNIFRYDTVDELKYYFSQFYMYYIPTPFPILGLLAIAQLIPNHSHEKKLKDLQSGKIKKDDSSSEISTASLDKVLDKLFDRDYDGTLIGASKKTGKIVGMPDSHVNQLALVVGTTGSGKTVTIRRFCSRAIMANYPLIIVDAKPTKENTAWVEAQARAVGKKFYGFNCGEKWNYNPLAHGGYTELKDKLICLKDEWESDYYRSIAEDYLQTTIEVLIASGEPFDLRRVVECLDFSELALIVRSINDPRLQARVKRIAEYERKDITGLQAHLNILVNSEMGEYFEDKPGKTFDLGGVISINAVVYFALPALQFSSFSAVLGKLIINDIKTVINRELTKKPIFTVFDEFSVFAGDQVLNLVNMGRGKGVHAVFGTQGISDLKRVSSEFSNQVLNCVNTIICHRVNDSDSVESITSWAGTRNIFDVTAQIGGEDGTGMGSVRQNKEYVIHPDSIKQGLETGEAFFISKVGKFRSEKIKVKNS